MTATVLLVEDHQMTLMGLKLLLERDAHVRVVGEASNGADAVRLAKQTRPDVILMDIGLPEMDGIEATQRIKADQPATRVIMLTSRTTSATSLRRWPPGLTPTA